MHVSRLHRDRNYSYNQRVAIKLVLQLIRGVMCLLGDPFDAPDSYTIDNEAIEIILLHEMYLFLIKKCKATLAYFVII